MIRGCNERGKHNKAFNFLLYMTYISLYYKLRLCLSFHDSLNIIAKYSVFQETCHTGIDENKLLFHLPFIFWYNEHFYDYR